METHSETNHEENKQSTPDVKQSSMLKWIVFIFIFFVLLLIIPKIKNKINSIKTTEQSQEKSEVKSTPLSYTEYYTLRQGDAPTRVIIPDGYKCDYFGGGKKYYHQAQNSEKELWGGGSCPSGLGNPNATYADISYYNEEITVTCKFKKK